MSSIQYRVRYESILSSRVRFVSNPMLYALCIVDRVSKWLFLMRVITLLPTAWLCGNDFASRVYTSLHTILCNQ